MDDGRIHRRMRTRPYDLRRKVLLKNFLRDQMLHIPGTNKEPFLKLENSQERSSSHEESSIKKVDEDALSFTVVDNTAHHIQTSSNDDNNNNCNHENEKDLPIVTDSEQADNFVTPVNTNNTFSHSPNLVKFTDMFKKDSKNTSNRVVKSKNICKNSISPMKTRSFKKKFERVFYGNKKAREKFSSNKRTQNSSRSLFSMFKHRREQRHAKEIATSKRSTNNQIPTNVPAKSTVVNQSVQTDDSWVREEINKVHESNKRLKEENKLLSESLSYFMYNKSLDPQIRQCNSSYQAPDESNLMFNDYTLPPSHSNQDGWNLRSKVSRSKSVHEYNERYKVPRNNYRTKSMNVHNTRNYFLSNSRPLLPSYNDETNLSRLRKKNILTNLPNRSLNRNIQRRSSMPERSYSENNRWIGHGRSNSMRNTHVRKPFYALSADAFY